MFQEGKKEAKPMLTRNMFSGIEFKLAETFLMRLVRARVVFASLAQE